jgi:hypothetical protein
MNSNRFKITLVLSIANILLSTNLLLTGWGNSLSSLVFTCAYVFVLFAIVVVALMKRTNRMRRVSSNLLGWSALLLNIAVLPFMLSTLAM